jgi:PAS domain S-box-containing protein
MTAAGAVWHGSADALVAVRPDGHIALVNRTAEALLGYRWEELADRPLDALLPQLTSSAVSDAATETLTDLECACVRKDGSQFPARLTMSAVESDIGPLLSVSIYDAAEHERAQLRDILAAIVWSSHEAIIGKDLDGVITAWNPAAERMFGYRPAEAIGSPHIMLYPPERRTEAADDVRRARHGHVVDLHEAQCVCRDGTTITVNITVSPIADETGATVGVSTVARAITAHERAQATFHRLVAGIQLAMVAVDQHGTIIAVNPAAESLFDYRRDELLGRPVDIRVPDSLRDVHVAHRLDYRTIPPLRPLTNHLRLTGRRRQGDEFTASISLSPIETDDGPMVAATIIDVTGQVRLADEQATVTQRLEQTRRLESLGQLAGGAAHDVHHIPPTPASAGSAAPEGTPDIPRSARETARSVEPTGSTILVVDSEPGIGDLCQTMLQRAGYTVLAATDGRTALTAAANRIGPIDLLLTDLGMPGVLGTDLAEQIRQQRPNTKVLYMSGHAGEHLTGQRDAALIEKPFDRVTLLATVAWLLDHDPPIG